MRTKPTVTLACGVSIMPCEAGHVWVRLHRKDGRVFAAACVAAENAAHLQEQFGAALEAAEQIALAQADCAGGVH